MDLVLPRGRRLDQMIPKLSGKDSVSLGPLFLESTSSGCLQKIWLNPSCCCLQHLMRLVMYAIHLECPFLPGSLWQHISPEKPLGSESVGTGPGTFLPFCAVLSPDDFREGEGGVQWMLPPLSFESPIYFLWQFAQIVKIPCNYHCIWKPNMIYIWQARSFLRWVGVWMCIYMCVYVCMYVISFLGVE